jgi:hypothetical protein
MFLGGLFQGGSSLAVLAVLDKGMLVRDTNMAWLLVLGYHDGCGSLEVLYVVVLADRKGKGALR